MIESNYPQDGTAVYGLMASLAWKSAAIFQDYLTAFG
jgi:hypothetical protein